MSTFAMIIILLLSVAFWRQVAAFLAASVIVLIVFGFVFVLQTLSAGAGGFGG